ncbi:MAG: lytic transglycosylase [Litoreibacter sp.]|nr:lytic transglycosylase [Litoreibacter sp.]
MIHPFRAMALLLFLAACGYSGGSAPRNLDNACAILDQNPNWLREMKQVERKWGVPTHVLMATIYQESKFISDARPPHQYALGFIPKGRQSSALGYSQALDGTWKEYQREEGGFRTKRTRFGDAVDFMGWYMDESERRLGISKFDTRNQYLAYHEGRTGFARGSYNRKGWLMRVSSEVASRAETYRAQLIGCGKI